ncbi:hypothetical protein [Tropicibacter naphthalenivorans]|uniref:Uncharacterized protein n=1 Tax=Tropicibacter naphthalenivorans TaxID=441103 RepID=A0A0P1GKZ1_9RHOB|nr:hypothetical protein [Tropicibacter naphthalenivorans]CUH75370.1 hypothetical protein TRN7648_00405 [Tropicibacter naphthalenivorans]SMC44790.1 hypothetical protein SAMN04488093_101474 [Tropicibacter naphthalenivorans]
MWVRVVVLIFCLLTAVQAQAGAWPRTKGTGFGSAAVRLSWPQNIQHWTSAMPTQQYYTLYLEYGLTDRVTLGLDLGRSVSGAAKTVAFVQMPIRNKDSGPKISGQLAFGRVAGDMVIRPGLSLGWGLQKGWFSVDSVAEIHLPDKKTDYKLDITWGRNLPRDRKLILQLQTGDTAEDPPFARFAPSYVRPLKGKYQLETGVTVGLIGDSSMGIKFGLWADF